jgi:hypothetical protein
MAGKAAYIARREKRKATPAAQRLEGLKKEELSEGIWDLGMFSPPSAKFKCDHVTPWLVMRGGLPLYRCDDCDHYFLINAEGFVMPKQHIAAYGLFLMAHFLKYEGPDALAQALARPHVRIDKDGHPNLSPIEIMNEFREEWDEAMAKLPDLISQAKALNLPSGGHKELASGNSENGDNPDPAD